MKTGEVAKDRTLLLSAILADAINLGLTKMAESSPGATYAKLSWLQARHIRDETYTPGLAELVNAQFRYIFAANWGDGTASSSDGERFRVGAKPRALATPNMALSRAVCFIPISPTSARRSARGSSMLACAIQPTYVLDGLLYHESDLRIEEHYTDTAGFTDHAFAVMHLLGFRFAPRIRDLGDTKLYIPSRETGYPALKPMIGGALNIKHLRAHWEEVLRLATSWRLARHGPPPSRHANALATRSRNLPCG